MPRPHCRPAAQVDLSGNKIGDEALAALCEIAEGRPSLTLELDDDEDESSSEGNSDSGSMDESDDGESESGEE